ncbi:MAG: hypothetical protein HYT21_02870 [Candidatus Nealsonbacteria bacterium]|nr:hypothetical protein [Candidatus Nealsonbacteria bacterium]
MLWLIVTIVAYFILAAVFLVDKYLLTSSIPNARAYAFYIGILGIGVLVFAPFVDLYFLNPSDMFLAFVSGATFLFGIFWFFKGLKKFETSRMIPAVGGLLPIFTILLIYLISWGRETLAPQQILAFFLLIGGSVLITMEKASIFSWKSMKFAIVAAFFLSVSFVSAKFVYLNYPFLLSLIWIKLGGALFSLIFLFDADLRSSLFQKRMAVKRKTAVIFFAGQAAGAAANMLQNWSIALAPLIYVAFINALQGAQYGFLFLLTILFSLKFPRILKEELNRQAVIQKSMALLLLGAGLAMLALI